MSKMTVYYLFYERDDEGTWLVARLDGMTFSGEKAASTERFLRAEGWPEIEPDRILHGSRVWAARMDEQSEGEDSDQTHS
ncbi:MAG: hypothetical protein ABI621_11230 [Chloroflexota bacterium]